MNKEDLQKWLLSSKGFQQLYQNLVMDSVASEFPALTKEFEVLDWDWGYLLECASLLSQSDIGECQDAALRIAQTCLMQEDLDDVYKDAAVVILDSLGNLPAMRLAEQRNFVNPHVEHRLPFVMQLDWAKRDYESTIYSVDGEIFHVNRFQKEFWEKVSRFHWVSVSAPTSAGKSFILKMWIAEYLRQNSLCTVVYVVPTRALIAEVQADLEELLTKSNIDSAAVSSLPLQSHLKIGVSNVLILTQERLHIFLSDGPNMPIINLMIIDEAQKIGDDYRGVLLQQAIENVTSASSCQKYLQAL